MERGKLLVKAADAVGRSAWSPDGTGETSGESPDPSGEFPEWAGHSSGQPGGIVDRPSESLGAGDQTRDVTDEWGEHFCAGADDVALNPRSSDSTSRPANGDGGGAEAGFRGGVNGSGLGQG